mmetsp:Transcript_66846/g.156667  ORF Transcript_66846/g.156667 Transcript_66846/m.156667 type:complete len:280 (+) Transcript_66846:145-984(+)
MIQGAHHRPRRPDKAQRAEAQWASLCARQLNSSSRPGEHRHARRSSQHAGRAHLLSGHNTGRCPSKLQDLGSRLSFALRRANPMTTGSAIRSGRAHKFLPGVVVLRNQLQRSVGVVNFTMKFGIPFATTTLELIHPGPARLDAPGRNAFYVLNGVGIGESTLRVHVHNHHLPICLAFIDQADGTKHTASDNRANLRWSVREVNHIQRIIIPWSLVELVSLLWIPIRLREAAVVERDRLAESRQLLGALYILLNHVVWSIGLYLILSERAHWHFVDVTQE